MEVARQFGVEADVHLKHLKAHKHKPEGHAAFSRAARRLAAACCARGARDRGRGVDEASGNSPLFYLRADPDGLAS